MNDTSEGQFSPALVDEALTFVQMYPDSRLVPGALLIAARTLARGGSQPEAASHLAVIVIAWPENPRWTVAALELGQLYAEDLGDDIRAEIVFRALIERYPESQEAGRARELLETL